MPHIQILPQTPSFGDKLAPVLAQAIGNIGQGFAQRETNSAIDNLTKQLQDPNKTELERYGILNKLAVKLPPEQAKALLPFYASSIIRSRNQQQNVPNGIAPNQPYQPGIPQGQAAPITAQTQPIENQANVAQPAPTGQTDDELDARRQELYSEVGLPYGIGERAEQELADIRSEKKIAASERGKEETKLDKIQEPIISALDAAEISRANLNRIKALRNTGNVINPVGAYLSQMFGVPVSLVSNADTEEFQKLVAQRGLNVGAAYGFGRILDKEFSNFLQTIPNLLNSPEGIDRIIGTLEYFDNLATARYGAYREILSQNPKAKAREIELKLADRMRPEYAKFGEILRVGPTFNELPDAKSLKGEQIVDDEGNVLKSDGKEWVKVKK